MSERERSKRRPQASLLTNVGLALLFVSVLGGGLWHTMTRPPEPDLDAEAAARRARRKPLEPAPEEVRTVESSGEWTTPATIAGTVETAEAMDWTGLRFQVSRLRMAALEGNPAGQESAAMGIKLYGGKAARFLDEEIARESDPVVRSVFQDARKGMK